MPHRIECHVFGGLGWPFTSRGVKELDNLIDKMDPIWDASVWPHSRYKSVLSGILSKWQGKTKKPVIALVGHSYGALRCIQIADALAEEGFKVHYIGGIDPTALWPWMKKMHVPPNVVTVDEFWASSGFPANARRRSPSGKRGGMYIKNSVSKHKIFKYKSAHIPLASNKKVHERIVKMIGEVT